ncbi:MAG TPA: hypothetical protein VG245_09355 [Candidatus Dormibacteraeota bacterium]|jgi:hypothetical protein|nr:hypothetical protein [Candidatus Dormibacteraeota bacterium]
MSTRPSRNLTLHRETVRELSAETLARAEGGCNCSDICPALVLISEVLFLVDGRGCAFT